MCLNVKDPFESKYQLLINRKEKVGNKKLKDPEALIDYSQKRKPNILLVFISQSYLKMPKCLYH